MFGLGLGVRLLLLRGACRQLFQLILGKILFHLAVFVQRIPFQYGAGCFHRVGQFRRALVGIGHPIARLGGAVFVLHHKLVNFHRFDVSRRVNILVDFFLRQRSGAADYRGDGGRRHSQVCFLEESLGVLGFHFVNLLFAGGPGVGVVLQADGREFDWSMRGRYRMLQQKLTRR